MSRSEEKDSDDELWAEDDPKTSRQTVNTLTEDDPKTSRQTVNTLTEDDEYRTWLQYIAHGFQGKGIKRAKLLYKCVHDYDNIKKPNDQKRCSRLINKYPPGPFRYFHAWKSRGGRKRSTKRATKRTRRR